MIITSFHKEEEVLTGLWSIVSDKVRKRESIDCIRDSDKRMIADRQHITNEFNKYFATIGKRLTEKCGVNVRDSLHKPLRNPNTIAFFLSDDTEVMGIIKELKNNKASTDEIKAEILKKIAPFI
ncbi:hypothetical protein HHI36_010403 [Cryptolaemus montrouzieri]|uniref:Uncharacterized protein n=1 Tax=Cryptolaemus montrouzieri TaxID=559131 RepID=A0ABD2MII6_9CUCU